MAVREMMLTLLAVEPTYGFHLHTELVRRIPHRRTLNVGQSYATLERLTKAGLVEPAGVNDESLPIHRITSAGERVVREWLGGLDGAGAPVDESSERVLLVLSLGDALPASMRPTRDILTAERGRWVKRIHETAERLDVLTAATEKLAQRQSEAVLQWLDDLETVPLATYALEFAAARPKRGRPRRHSGHTEA